MIRKKIMGIMKKVELIKMSNPDSHSSKPPDFSAHICSPSWFPSGALKLVPYTGAVLNLDCLISLGVILRNR